MNTRSAVTLCLAGFAALVTSQGSYAHTRLRVPQVNESTGVVGSHSATINYNDVVIAHGCSKEDGTMAPVIAHSVVFPDGIDSILERSDGGDVSGGIAEFLQSWPHPEAISSDDVFDKSTVREKYDSLGNVVGFSYTGGALKGTIRGLVPFYSSAVFFQPDSCAQSVTVVPAIADICKVTTIDAFSDASVGLWTPAVNSKYDGPGLHGYNSPATLKVVRTSPLPASCGGVGFDVTMKPSAKQINRNMPIPGFWPKPAPK